MLIKTVLFLLIFCLPFQLGLHFWPSWSFLAGFRIDYLSPTIFLTDIFICLYLILSLKTLVQKIKSIDGKFLILIVLVIVFNLFISLNPLITLLAWVRNIFYLLLLIALSSEKKLLEKIFLPLSLSLITIIILEILQFLLTSSIGGPFYLLGERQFDLSTPNIAKLDLPLIGQIIRPYSTFSHPNSLAGFLLICLLVIRLKKKFFLNILITIGIFLTFSKIAITAFLLSLVLSKTSSKNHHRLKIIILILTLLISLLPLINLIPNLPFNFNSSFLSRLYLGQINAALLSDHLFFGVGLNNYLPAIIDYLPSSQLFFYSLQPVHSLLLLSVSELGLLILFIFFLLVLKFKIIHTLPLLFILFFTLTGAVDHYWWTLTQNKLILILFFSLIFNQHDQHLLSKSNH